MATRRRSILGRPASQAWRVLGALALAWSLSWNASAAVTCTNTAGPPGSETTATISIVSPEQGAVLTDCSATAEITGTWTTSQPPRNYDFYIVIDYSGSTSSNSGADVNGDGVIGGSADNILRAEIAAARAFVEALPPAQSRVAIIVFDDTATVRQPLTADLGVALATLDGMSTLQPGGGTHYVAAMNAVEAQVTTLGDPSRSQRCDFLSDGVPSESLTQTDAAATRLAGLGVVIDTFALGNISSNALENMATISGGTFTALAIPGDIVAALPAMLSGIRDFAYSIGSASGNVVADTDGTFTVTVPLTPGANHVELTMTAGDPTVVTVTCAIDFTTGELSLPDAGPSPTACVGSPILLDGSATLTSCASTLYRWLDCNGDEACAASTSPTCVTTCNGCASYTLETSCAGGACALTDTVPANCVAYPPTPVPTVVRSCGLSTTVSCGAATSSSWRWDRDTAVDSNGDGDPVHDPDLSGCSVTINLTAPGTLSLEVWRDNGGCRVSAPLVVDVVSTPTLTANGGLDQTACTGSVVHLDGSASTVSSGTTLYRWLDCRGVEVAPQSTNPLADVVPCGTCSYYTLEIASSDVPACVATDRVNISCTTVVQPRPTVTLGCDLDAALACGASSSTTTFGWDLDPLTDSDGDGDPETDSDAAGCNVTATMPAPGPQSVVCWARRGATCRLKVPLEFEIAPDLVTTANAGPDRSPCRATSVVLDGSLSTTNAGTLEYRWLNCSRSQLRGWSTNPIHTVTCSSTCYILQVRSTAGPSCVSEDSVTITCTTVPTTPAPRYLGPCGADVARLTCGRTTGAQEWGWDLAIGTDTDGNGDPMDDADLIGCDQDIPLDQGRWPVAAWGRNAECVVSQRLDVEFWPAAPRDLTGGACVGHLITLTCGTLPPGATAWWDLDAATDFDGDGNPENDQEFPGCDVTFTGIAGRGDVRGWIEDVPGCVRLVAFGVIDVGSGLTPGHVTGLRVAQRLGAGDDGAAWMTWDTAPDANEYRVLRGSISRLWSARAYDHLADPDLAIGACSTPAPSFMAAGERLAPDSYYYLVTAVTDCGGEGPTGHAWSPASSPPRPARIPTLSCP